VEPPRGTLVDRVPSATTLLHGLPEIEPRLLKGFRDYYQRMRCRCALPSQVAPSERGFLVETPTLSTRIC
jgi:hypothetical protein